MLRSFELFCINILAGGFYTLGNILNSEALENNKHLIKFVVGTLIFFALGALTAPFSETLSIYFSGLAGLSQLIYFFLLE